MEELPIKAEVERFKARGSRYEVKDSVVPGLRLRVAATGARTWTLTYRTTTGDHSRFTLGTFPETTLAKARALATTKREDVKRGGDPQAEKREARTRAKAAKGATAPKTVEALAQECIESLPLRPSTRREWLRLTRAEIAPAFKDRPAKELTRAEVREWARKLAKRSGYIANRSFGLLRRIFSWAVSEDILPASPLVRVPKPFKGEVESERVLTAVELQAVMLALDTLEDRAATLRRENETEGPGSAYVAACRLLLLTGVRRSAVIGMKREELEGLDTLSP
ncbi:MAG: Arm DNA-binding domain-containing protein, partial [Vicinamibacteria bacterium]